MYSIRPEASLQNVSRTATIYTTHDYDYDVDAQGYWWSFKTNMKHGRLKNSASYEVLQKSVCYLNPAFSERKQSVQ